MSINLPSRQLLRSASIPLICPHHRPSPDPRCLPISLLTTPQPARWRWRVIRHFQNSASSRKAPTLRPNTHVEKQTQTPLQTTTASRPGGSKSSLLKSEQSIKRLEDPQEEMQKRADEAAALARARLKEIEQTAPKRGSLAENSLFADPVQSQGRPDSTTRLPGKPRALDPAALELRNPNHLAAAINPVPEARTRGLRRMVIRNIRQRGRLTKAVTLARTERSSLSKSHFFLTSMKKLAPLARQIAGKPIDEAILQMRFSKKKVAKDVREHLIQAKHEAIVRRGLSLGHLEQQEETAPISPSLEASSPTSPPPPPQSPRTLPGTSIAANPALRPPTSIYIAQAWINRGPYGVAPDHRAFGRIYSLRPPHTGLSVLLKEERTRMREVREKEEKRIRQRRGKGMWTQLPDRKVTRQGQYLLW